MNNDLKIGFYIKDYLKQNKYELLSYLFCFFVGIILAIFVSFSSTNYLGLLESQDKQLINIINGTVSYSKLMWSVFSKYFFPCLFAFVLSLNYFLSFASFGLLAYQGVVFCLTIKATLEVLGFAGIFKILFLILPINLIGFATIVFVALESHLRAKWAYLSKDFLYGFDKKFALKLSFSIILLLIIAFVFGVVFPFMLKSAIFVIF